MILTWDERKRHANLAKHDLDFRTLTPEFFGSAVTGPARPGRYVAVGIVETRVVTVIFRALGREAFSIISMRPANKKERDRVQENA